MLPADDPFLWGLPEMRGMLMDEFSGASAVRVLLLDGGCDGVV